ncbi:hypothetical protein BS78_K330100 [Paspalum vaginatum]|uniref:Uncharacterized protein n=1 Tax=Paspalum vaginatum TaxID=158149 RepID=A0A9W7XB15_9POAL|nr:hypothetical protein BS78_K330100 [Paspalum vaginatum]
MPPPPDPNPLHRCCAAEGSALHAVASFADDSFCRPSCGHRHPPAASLILWLDHVLLAAVRGDLMVTHADKKRFSSYSSRHPTQVFQTRGTHTYNVFTLLLYC